MKIYIIIISLFFFININVGNCMTKRQPKNINTKRKIININQQRQEKIRKEKKKHPFKSLFGLDFKPKKSLKQRIKDRIEWHHTEKRRLEKNKNKKGENL